MSIFTPYSYPAVSDAEAGKILAEKLNVLIPKR
jgi:hypothetical protein